MREVLFDAFRTAFSKKIMWAAVIAVPVITALFGFLYVYTFLDPYDRMKDLPVAIINLDKGVSNSADAAERKNYGRELEESLLENSTVKWTEEGESLLDSGIENSDYYMAVIIPADFSKKITAGETAAPEQANIIFYKNVRKNYMLATLSVRVENEIYKKINRKIGEQYTAGIVYGIYDIRDGFQDAAEGALELNGGAQELYLALNDASNGANTLSDGAGRLIDATGEVSNGVATLKTGTSTLAEKASPIPDSSAQIKDGAAAILEGIGSAVTATELLNEAAASLNNGLLDLQEAAAQITELSTAIVTGLEAASSYSDAAAEAADNASNDIYQAIAMISSGAPSSEVVGILQAALMDLYKVNAISSEVSTSLYGQPASLGAAAAGIGLYSSGIQAGLGCATEKAENKTLIGLSNSLDAGLESLETGLSQSADAISRLYSGADSMTQGSTELVTAIRSLEQGADRIGGGIDSLKTGLQQSYTGSRSLADGITEAVDGAWRLSDGADDLGQGLSDGLATIEKTMKADADSYIKYIGEPVVMQENTYGDLGSFGFGFAPLFLTMCFWLGAFLIFFVVSPFPSERIKGATRYAMYFGRMPVYLMILALEIAIVLIFSDIIGIPKTDAFAFAALVCTIAFSFMCIMYFLNIFGVIGKALSILILVFQLVTASGTFPVVLGQSFAGRISPFFPYTYAIDGYREVMSGGNMLTLYFDIGMLLVFAGISIVCSLIVYPRMRYSELI